MTGLLAGVALLALLGALGHAPWRALARAHGGGEATGAPPREEAARDATRDSGREITAPGDAAHGLPRGVVHAAGALATGAALWGLAGFLLNVLGAPLAAWQLLAAALASLGCGAWWGRRARAVRDAAAGAPNAASSPGAASRSASPAASASASAASSPAAAAMPREGAREGDLLGALARALLPLVVLLGAAAAVGQPFRGDGGKFWLPKARDVALHGVPHAPALQDPAHLGFHRGYPLLGPALLAPAVELAPPDAHAAPKAVLAGLHAALLVLLAARLLGAGARGRWLALLALGMPVWVALDPAASPGAGGLLDGVLALFLLLLVDAVDGARRGDRAAARAAGVWAAACACTKLEGGVSALLVLGAATLAGPRRRVLARALPALLAAGAVLALFAARVPASPSIARVEWLLDPANLAARVPVLLAGFAGLLLDAPRFGLLPLALLVTGLSPAGRRARFAWWLALGVAAFLAVVYLSTSMHLGRHLETSAHRLLLQWLPAFALLGARAGTAGDAAGDPASPQAPRLASGSPARAVPSGARP